MSLRVRWKKEENEKQKMVNGMTILPGIVDTVGESFWNIPKWYSKLPPPKAVVVYYDFGI